MIADRAISCCACDLCGAEVCNYSRQCRRKLKVQGCVLVPGPREKALPETTSYVRHHIGRRAIRKGLGPSMGAGQLKVPQNN
eukprot:6182508-Pleurochrysis_carterae.AAC.1